MLVEVEKGNIETIIVEIILKYHRNTVQVSAPHQSGGTDYHCLHKR